jgi:hypothetical protein
VEVTVTLRLPAALRKPAVAVALSTAVAATVVAGLGMRGPVVAAAPSPCGPHFAITPALPASFSVTADRQTGADCKAWQAFIHLNWPSDPSQPCAPSKAAGPGDFGKPTGYTTVWESYPVASSLFTANPSFCGTGARSVPAVKVLRSVSKFGDSVVDFHGVPSEAFSSWLTDQDGGLTYFEIHVNKDEAQYIKDNGLYSAAGQAKCAAQRSARPPYSGGLMLPKGYDDVDCAGRSRTYGDNVGSIELKAAWVVLAKRSQYAKYLTAQADVYPPNGSKPKRVTVGLVGLHIVRKMPGAERMLWSTFEHVDNAPDVAGGSPSPVPGVSYTYYNPRCDPSTDRYQCALNAPPSAPPSGTPSYTAPVQVARVHPIGARARGVNAAVHALLAKDSVFRNYELVDVMWPLALNQVIPPGSRIPLDQTNMTSETRAVANTALETYFQQVPPSVAGSRTCLHCHSFASIAAPGPQRMVRGPNGRPARVIRIFDEPAGATPPPFASDYSFIFGSKGDS